MLRFIACGVMAAGLVACGGGDLCAEDVSVLSGTWEVSVVSNGDVEKAFLVIDDEGNVNVDTDNDDWTCDLVSDQLCALSVHCEEKGGSGEFTVSLTKK
jgi:hypothetical protein